MATEDPGHPEEESVKPGAPAEPAAERETEAPEAPGPTTPNVEDRLNRIETMLTQFAERAQATERGATDTPPTTAQADTYALAEAERLQRELEELAQSDPSFRSLLKVNEGLYNHFNRKIDELRVEAQFERIADDEERGMARKAFKTGDFKTVAAAHRAARGDLLAQRGQDSETERRRARETERVKSQGDVSIRGVPADEAAQRRTTRDQYLRKVGDPSVPMEERIRLRREKDSGKLKVVSR